MRCSERKGKRSFNGDKGIKNDACEKRWWRLVESGSLARENRPKEGWIYSVKMYIVSLYNDAARTDVQSPFPLIIVTLTTIYEFVEIFIMRRCLFIITEPSDFYFVLSCRGCATERNSFEILLALLFLWIALCLPALFHLLCTLWFRIEFFRASNKIFIGTTDCF